MIHAPFFFPALLIAAIGLPLVLGLVPPNRYFGVRTRTTIASPQIWYAANRFGGAILVASAGISLVVSAIVPYEPGRFDLWVPHALGFAVPMFTSVILIILYVRGSRTRQ